ncbi:MAG TPA: GtrA family protein [Flavipsychrobacter sp.]|nr:GtrA family protein [Flavipsychrobacter sp.]
MFHAVRNIILAIIDFVHIPFQKWIDKQTFRYLACGGGNTVLDIFIYFISYNFVLQKQPVHTFWITISPHIAAFMISFSISFPLGFLLSKYVVFTESNLKGRIQLFRYIVLVSMCILLNYVFLKFFVEWCGFFPTASKILTTGIVAIFSYISQRNFTFKVKEVLVENNTDA